MMEGLLVYLLAFATIAILALLNLKHPKKKLPPGPKPWPIIGNLNLMGPIPHQSLHMLSQKYGGIMQLKFGQFPVVVVSTPEMAKHFLKTHDIAFASRPALSAGKHTSYNFSDVVWAPYGPYWRNTRKAYMLEVLSTKRIESEKFERIRIEERRDLIKSLHSLSGKPIWLRDHLFRFALFTINRMVMGKRFFGEFEEEGEKGSIVGINEFQGLFDEWFLLNGVFNVGDWIPWLNFFDLQGYVKRMKSLKEKFDPIYESVVSDRLKKRKVEGDVGDASKDVLDELLAMADDPEVILSMDCVKALIQNLLIGGADTTPTTIEWIFHELMRNPRIYKKAKDELDMVIGRNKWVEEKDFNRLPYLDAIIMETLRLHPAATLLVPHYATEDCRVEGYDIPKGTTIFVNAWSIGRNPDSWDNPEEFFPERFLGKEIDVTGNNFALLPFGSGRRRCPGYGLALLTVPSIVANLLHGFDMKLAHGMRPEDVSVEEKYRLSTHPKEIFEMILEPTLPAHLY